MAHFTDRVRLPRGRHIHAAGNRPDSPHLVTACKPDQPLELDGPEWFDEGESVTCPACLRAVQE